MKNTRLCYSICERKRNKYVTEVNGETIILGSEDNRVLFFDENEAENYRQLADDTMSGCFQIIVEKESNNHLIERIIASDVLNDAEQNSDSVLWDIIKDIDTEDYAISHQLFEIYQETTDKKSFKEMFRIIFGVSFDEYLERCENNIKTSANA